MALSWLRPTNLRRRRKFHFEVTRPHGATFTVTSREPHRYHSCHAWFAPHRSSNSHISSKGKSLHPRGDDSAEPNLHALRPVRDFGLEAIAPEEVSRTAAA